MIDKPNFAAEEALFLAMPTSGCLSAGIGVLVGLWSPQAGIGVGLVLWPVLGAAVTAGLLWLAGRVSR